MSEIVEHTRRLLDICKRHGVLVATAESCTGGMIISLMTDLPGSSSMVDRGFITYSNEAKMRRLGVDGDLLARHGAPLPPADATHMSCRIGRHMLKWESHTEFVTYSAFCPGVSARPFDPAEAEVFPARWQAEAPGRRICAVLLRVDQQGPACHTGRPNCFYNAIRDDAVEVITAPLNR